MVRPALAEGQKLGTEAVQAGRLVHIQGSLSSGLVVGRREVQGTLKAVAIFQLVWKHVNILAPAVTGMCLLPFRSMGTKEPNTEGTPLPLPPPLCTLLGHKSKLLRPMYLQSIPQVLRVGLGPGLWGNSHTPASAHLLGPTEPDADPGLPVGPAPSADS